MDKPKHIGGSFAPPLTDEKLLTYDALVKKLPVSPVKDAMVELLACCQKWWNLPESKTEGVPHPCGRGTVVALETPIATALWDNIPWQEELAMMSILFDKIDPNSDKDLRNAAFHLLWHVNELNLDREPITNDKL